MEDPHKLFKHLIDLASSGYCSACLPSESHEECLDTIAMAIFLLAEVQAQSALYAINLTQGKDFSAPGPIDVSDPSVLDGEALAKSQDEN